jgi:diguanylate cyclase (GGDEF)-like protein
MSKRAEAERLRMVVETQSEIAGSRLDLDEVMRRVVERAREITDAAAAVVEMADGDELVYRAASGTATQFIGLRMEADKSLSGLCMDTGQLLRCDDASTDPRVNAELCLRLGAVSVICVPLQHPDGGFVGVLKLYASQPEAFDAADEETLGLLSGVIAAHLTNATEFAAVRDDSRRDALTGLGNRRAYDEALIREAARAARYGSLLSLALFDVDGFKAVNDSYGHPRGDAVLAEVGRILASGRSGDQAFRVGGDEFALVLVETGLNQAQLVAGRMVEAVAGSVQIQGQATLSMGLAEARSLDPRALHAEADAALQRSKQARAEAHSRRSERRWGGNLRGPEETPR